MANPSSEPTPPNALVNVIHRIDDLTRRLQHAIARIDDALNLCGFTAPPEPTPTTSMLTPQSQLSLLDVVRNLDYAIDDLYAKLNRLQQN